MDPDLLKVFHRQIWTQCEFALIAYDELGLQIADAEAASEWAQRRSDEFTGLPFDEAFVRAQEIALEWRVRTWQPVQGLLTAVGNIAKALWGADGRRSAEREPLRLALDVRDSSPLRPCAMRNNFELFDEVLDDWWRSSLSHRYVDLDIAAERADLGGAAMQDTFRSYDPATEVVVFWGQRYVLPPIIDEIEHVARGASTGAF
jgi:hypothetical protein